MSSERIRAAVLISGSGSNLQSFINKVQSHELELDIAVVISNRADAFGLQRAAEARIPTQVIEHADYADRETFDQTVAAELEKHAVDLIILAGFMRILSPWFVQRFAGRILNIHPALLPAYPGLNTHQRVLDAGDRQHGSTVHFVTEELDGGPLVMQGRLAVSANENAAELAARVQSVEHQIYPAVAALFAAGRLRYESNNAYLDRKKLERPMIKDFA